MHIHLEVHFISIESERHVTCGEEKVRSAATRVRAFVHAGMLACLCECVRACVSSVMDLDVICIMRGSNQ